METEKSIVMLIPLHPTRKMLIGVPAELFHAQSVDPAHQIAYEEAQARKNQQRFSLAEEEETDLKRRQILPQKKSM